MPSQATIHIRQGQAPKPITRADFHARFNVRFNVRFYDPAFEVERDAIVKLVAAPQVNAVDRFSGGLWP